MSGPVPAGPVPPSLPAAPQKETLKKRLLSILRRLGFHCLALLYVTGAIAQNEHNSIGMGAYAGLLCLFPAGCKLRENIWLFPAVIAAGQFLLLFFRADLGPGPALYVAGLQSWLLGAIFRRFRLGTGWLVAPILALCFPAGWERPFPYAFFALGTLCGCLAYYCNAWYERHKAAAKQAQPAKLEEEQTRAKGADFAEFSASAFALRGKGPLLPAALQASAEAIAQGAESIVELMRDDPADRPGGARFLARYLPAAHKILDECVRLRAGGGGHARVQESLDNSAYMLERLSAAFQEERELLLRNDALRLDVEIKTLDRLLKMDGR